jgi:hypothetical protein
MAQNYLSGEQDIQINATHGSNRVEFNDIRNQGKTLVFCFSTFFQTRFILSRRLKNEFLWNN